MSRHKRKGDSTKVQEKTKGQTVEAEKEGRVEIATEQNEKKKKREE